ncbi:VOC family protein [Jannaschia donghaensis]|uniref:Glyoxalase-like domain protein n=1 Tax=Jannaschia donghaensis TaxID=420998 RepID=A0A0M6YEV2_9RHOB|nr:VOC family protein [Jannaschia donghaensis]CTQ48289.1 Glyoxalase-like domain protein [Jannaschia donghaensis]
MARLEHANLTVGNAEAFADVLCAVFAWSVRWSGDVLGGAGRSVHVGGADSYLALYEPGAGAGQGVDTYVTRGGLNHLGVVVDDLDQVEARVVAAGYHPHNHAAYEPGRRFYFDGPEGVEIEVVAYA